MSGILYRLIHGKKPIKHLDIIDCIEPYSECEKCKLYDWCYYDVEIY